MNNVEKAVSCFNEGFACSQSILSTYGEELGLNRELGLKVSGAFGGGMVNMGDTCGAVTGALMVIGLKYGRTIATDTVAKEMTYNFAEEFLEEFKQRNKTIVCKELLGCDISTPEGRAFDSENKICDKLCPKFVQDAAEILEEILF